MSENKLTPAELEQSNRELSEKLDEVANFLQRERADFLNFRRRSEEERAEISNLVKQELVLTLLPLLDNLSRAASHLPPGLAEDNWAKGVVQIGRQAEAVLEDLGVTKIETLGQPFDPAVHEALSSDGTGDQVVEELAPGYQVGETVLRPAMVKVGKRKGEK